MAFPETQNGVEIHGVPEEVLTGDGAGRSSHQIFFAQALHQPLETTLFFGNKVHGPEAAPAAPLKKLQLEQLLPTL